MNNTETQSPRTILPFIGPANSDSLQQSIEAHFSGSDLNYKNTRGLERKQAHEALRPILTGEHVSIPALAPYQKLGARNLQAQFAIHSREARLAHPEHFKLSHWLHAGEAIMQAQPDKLTLNLANIFSVRVMLAQTTMRINGSFGIFAHQLWDQVSAKRSVFHGAEFPFCQWQSCNLRGVNFCNASFSEGNWFDCDLRHANLHNASFHKMTIRNIKLDNAQLSNLVLDDVQFKQCDFTALTNAQILSITRSKTVTFTDCTMPSFMRQALERQGRIKPSLQIEGPATTAHIDKQGHVAKLTPPNSKQAYNARELDDITQGMPEESRRARFAEKVQAAREEGANITDLASFRKR